jgi:hypothetical protein
MRIPDEDWRMVSDPFEDWRLYQHVTPLIDDPAAGSVLLIIAEYQSKPHILLVCHTVKAFSIHSAEIKLMKGADIVTMGKCELLKSADSEGFIEPPFFKHPIQRGTEIMKFLETHTDEVQYRMKSPFRSHRGVIHAAGLTALRKAIAAVS